MNQNKIEALKERIHHLIELRKLLITAIIFLLGGLATLFITLTNWQGILVLATGILLVIILFALNKELANDIEKEIKKLEKGE